MAAQACNAPISLISFVASDRQWFKATIGTDLRETPLNVSICSHAIEQPDLFVVPDATKDSRFENNPLVKGEPHVRFYAGALLETSDGVPLGTVCILDYKPRTLNDQEASILKSLARQVMTQLELRRALAELRNSNENLKEAVAKFRALFEQSSVFAGIMTVEGIVLEANSLSLEGCGYPAEEVIGKPFWECGWWRGSKEVQLKIRMGTQQAKEGIPYLNTFLYKWADGTDRMMELALHPIRNESGQVIFIHPTGVDITERHRAQTQSDFLGKLTQKLSIVSDPLEINRIAAREIGQFLGVNRCYFFQTLQEPGRIHVLPDWHEGCQHSLEGDYTLADFGAPERWQALLRGPISITNIGTHPWTKDFARGYEPTEIVACMVAPFVHEGKWVACIGVSCNQARQWTVDETALLENAMARVWPLIERAKVERALRESESRFRAMSDNIAQLAWMANADGWLFWYNKRWYDYTGGTLETMQGDGWAKVHDPDHLSRVIANWTRAVSLGEPWGDTFPLRGTDGQYRWFLSRAFPIRNADGKIALWFGTNTDITDLREAQNALHAANAQLADKATHLETIVRQRTQKLSESIGELEAFSYSISHDMRAPLRSMIGFSEVLQEDYADKLDAQGVDYLNRISKASHRMDRLIQDVLSFSRVSQQNIELETVNIDVLIREIVHSYPNLHPPLVEIDIPATLPSVKGSEALLTQCFSNLLENGAKFTTPGSKAQIKVWAEKSEGRVKLCFQDNGIGMSKHNLERIFEIFHRVGRDNEGTGIGLAIVRKAVEKMGGTVGVSSELGKGSLFWLDLQSA